MTKVNFRWSNKIPFLMGIIAAGAILFGGSRQAFATVGGPTYISQIAYDEAKNAIYYIENDYGGRGCPPIIHSIDLTTGQDTEVKTCEQIFQEYFSQGREASNDTYDRFISDFFDGIGHKYLGSVSLKKNDINIKVESAGENVENGEINWTDFKAIVSQSSKTIGTIDFRGCDKEQPHIFEGYMIPNSDKIAILISNKSDCFEGGYQGESIHLINGVRYIDTKVVRGYKDASPTDLNKGNAVVLASSDDVGIKQVNLLYWAAQIGVLVAVTLIGFWVGRRSRRI